MRITPKHAYAILSLLLSYNIASAQSQTVLVNGEPTRVDLIGSDVTAVNNEVKGYMRGYERPPFDPFKKASPIPSPITRTATRSSQTVATSKPRTASTPATSVKPEGGLTFEGITTKLTASAKEQIKKIKSGEVKSVLLKSWHLAGNKISQNLIKQRLDACRAVFMAEGIGPNVILTSLTAGSEESKKVEVILE